MKVIVPRKTTQLEVASLQELLISHGVLHTSHKTQMQNSESRILPYFQMVLNLNPYNTSSILL